MWILWRDSGGRNLRRRDFMILKVEFIGVKNDGGAAIADWEEVTVTARNNPISIRGA
jgi:hypothetical protein